MQFGFSCLEGGHGIGLLRWRNGVVECCSGEAEQVGEVEGG